MQLNSPERPVFLSASQLKLLSFDGNYGLEYNDQSTKLYWHFGSI